MSNNKSIQILRASPTYDISQLELLDGQPFYNKGNKQLYVGDDSREELTPVGAANLIPGEGLDSVVQIYSGDVDSTHYGNTNTGESAAVFGEANNNSENRALIAGKLNKNSGANNIVGGLRNNVGGTHNIVSGQQNGGIGTTYNSVTRTAIKPIYAKDSLIVGQLNKAGEVDSEKLLLNSIVAGYSNNIEVTSGSLVVGKQNTIVNAENSSIMGQNNTITNGNNLNIIGYSNNIINADNSFVGGKNNTIGSLDKLVNYSLVVGIDNEEYSVASSVIGQKNFNYGMTSILGGANNTNRSFATLVIGERNTSGNEEKTQKDNIISGQYNSANASFSLLVGRYNQVNNHCSIIGGSYNIGKANTLLEIGNGTGESDNERSNAFEVIKDGRAKVYKAPQDNEDVVRKLELDKKIVKVAADVMIATKNTKLFMDLSKQFANGEIVIIGTMQGHNIVVNDVRYDQVNNTARWIVDFATFDGFTSAGGNGFGNAIFIIDCSDNKFTLIQRFIPQLNFEKGTGVGSIVQKFTGMAGDATDEMTNTNTGNYSAVFGHNNTNSNEGALVAGYYNAGETDALLEIGNGTSEKPNNAFTVFKDGHAEVQTQASSDNSIVIYSYLQQRLDQINEYINDLYTTVNSHSSELDSHASTLTTHTNKIQALDTRIGTSKGSNSQPVYVNNSGQITACNFEVI